MLPNEYVPRSPRKNVEFRLKLYRAMRANPRLRRGMRELCRKDLLFFVNAFVWQFNPRKKRGESPVGPFVSWDFQDKAFLKILWCIENDEDLVILKSREMGASWMCLIVMLWMWLFRGWQQFLCISRNAEAVDDASPDSLFWKVRFMLDHLPACLKPRQMRDNKMFFGNDDLHSTTNGQASTGKAGVGGRATAMFIDEFSQIVEAYQVLQRTSDTTGCRIFNFTFTGVDNAAYELSRRVDIKKLVMHWSQHPDKNKGCYRVVAGKVVLEDQTYKYPVDFNFVMDGSPTGGPYPGLRSPWYDRECGRKGSARAVAMDLDINPAGSTSQFFDALKIRQLQEMYCMPAVWQGDVEYDGNGKVLRLAQREGGPLSLWLNLDHSGKPPKGVYGFGCDVATGKAMYTPSCASGINAETGEKIFSYRSTSIEPEDFASMMVGICRLFESEGGSGARLCWECPGPGNAFGQRVVDLGYRNFYWRTQEGKISIFGPRETPGWYADPKSKLTLLREYKEGLESHQFLNRSKEALEECLSFEYLKSGYVEHGGIEAGDDPSGAKVNHGDECMADAMAWRVSKTAWKGRQQAKRMEVQPMSMLWRRQLRERKEAEEESWA